MSVEKYFKEEKYLPSILKGYRDRSSQVETASLIASSFISFSDAVIEAPTGSGKTMAYLIPAFDSGKKIIIATKTKQLMSQLMQKDIPSVAGCFGGNTKVKQLKGRKNYFCPERFYRLVMPKAMYYPDALLWYEEASLGAIGEVPAAKLGKEIINLITADRYQCKGSKCQFLSDCPFYFAKMEANAADVIVTNHHLLLSDMALKAGAAPGGIFEFRDHAIFDEAHAIPDIFAQYAGAELSLFAIVLFFNENKDKFSMAEFNKVQDDYFKISALCVEGRALYETLRNKIADFVGSCANTVENVGDEGLKDEFNRYLISFEEIEGDEEGLRIVERATQRVSVKFIPFESGETFRQGLKKSTLSAVFISATISSGGNFDYFMKETGLDKTACITAGMPAVFDFRAQGKLYVPQDDQLNDKDGLYAAITPKIKGSVLIICNSLDRMRKVGELLKFCIKDKQVLFQTDISIGNLDLEKEVILVGCASLREGIDLSGGEFRCVIIDKLPFEYFKDLYLNSKAEKIKREQGDPFKYFFLPRAVLYFKQAVGRLIRHENDKGVWAIFDKRILTENYGKYFLDVLDNVDITRSHVEALNFIKGEYDGKTDIRL